MDGVPGYPVSAALTGASYLSGVNRFVYQDDANPYNTYRIAGLPPGPYVAAHVASFAHEAKRWSEERYAALFERLATERGLPVVLLGSAAEHLAESRRLSVRWLVAPAGAARLADRSPGPLSPSLRSPQACRETRNGPLAHSPRSCFRA